MTEQPSSSEQLEQSLEKEYLKLQQRAKLLNLRINVLLQTTSPDLAEAKAILSEMMDIQTQIISCTFDAPATGIVGSKLYQLSNSFSMLVNSRGPSVEKKIEQAEASVLAQQSTGELTNWLSRIQPLLNKLAEIDSLDEQKVKPVSKDPGVLSSQEIGQLIFELRNLQRAHATDLDEISVNNQLVRDRIRQISSEGGGIYRALEKLERMRNLAERKMPVDQLPYEELIKELGKIDPAEKNKYGQALTSGSREQLLVFAFNSRNPLTERVDSLDEDEVFNERLRLLALKYEYLLGRMMATMSDGTGSASTDRSQLMKQLNIYQCSRRDLLMATTHHPKWGGSIRSALRWLIETPAKKPGSSENPDGLTYETFASASGMDNFTKALNKYCETNPEFSSYDENELKLIKNLITELYCVFDLLTITLQELQHNTRTRLHNQSIDMVDPISLQDPLSAYIHALSRYGANEKDWRGWWLVYLEDIPRVGDPNYTERFGTKNRGGVVDPDKIADIQRLVKLHQDSLFPIDAFAGKIKLPKFCQSFFPDTYDLITLGEVAEKTSADRREIVEIMGRYFDNAGRLGARPNNSERRFSDFGNYDGAFKGWRELLELTYQSTGTNLSEAQIMESITQGGKGGLLAKWFQTAGLAKIFCPKHLRIGLEPMLTHYVYRLIVSYNGNLNEKRALRDKIVHAIDYARTSGGLSAFPLEMGKVIDNLKNDNILVNPYYGRKSQRHRYLNAWWDDEYKDVINPPRRPREIMNVGILTPEQKQFVEMLNDKIPPHLPLERNGTMIQDKKAGD